MPLNFLSKTSIAIFFLIIIVNNKLIGQPIDSIENTSKYLEEVCLVCKNGDLKNKLLDKIKEGNVNHLFHQFHIFFSNRKQNPSYSQEINKIAPKLKTELESNKTVASYHFGYHFCQGILFLEKKLYKTAVVSFEKSLNYSCPPYFQGAAHLNLAGALFGIKKYSEALSALSEAERLFINNPELRNVYARKASIHLLQGKFEESEKVYLNTIQVDKKFQDSSNLILSHTDLANFYYEQYLDDQAIPLFKKALAIAKKVKDPEKLRDAHYNMHIVYNNLEDYKNALIELQAYLDIRDTLNNAQQVRKLTSLEKEQEKQLLEEQKNKEIAIVEKNNQLLMGSILAALLILGLLAYFYTNIRRQNKIIATQKQEVEQLNTIKDELLSVLGHDLRSPMQHLISVFDRSFKVLKKGDEQKLHRLLQHGNLAVSQTSILLDNVLQWVTQQNQQGYFKKETVALFPLVQQIQATFLPITKMQKIELINQVPADINVLGDRNSLKIIIRNLVDNAIKFTPENGQVTISATTDSKGQQAIHIQDTGVGMSKEIIANLLTTSAATTDVSGRKSTGLGLRICKDFIRRHDGELQIESVEGEGSRFSVWLPVE